MAKLQKITPCLWFEGDAEDAVQFYLSVFPSGRIVDTLRYGDGAHMPKGTVLTITFDLNGSPFIALNAPPHDKFNDAISLHVACETQDEIDALWTGLTADGGRPVQCGWLKDKYGVSWQITPTALQDMLQAGDPKRSERVMKALLQMVKLDIAELQKAYDG
ncbi:MAG: VOC family protein [Hyphomicrobium sp.]|nr:VOC family protein [Hyphomicrobium sp.]